MLSTRDRAGHRADVPVGRRGRHDRVHGTRRVGRAARRAVRRRASTRRGSWPCSGATRSSRTRSASSSRPRSARSSRWGSIGENHAKVVPSLAISRELRARDRRGRRLLPARQPAARSAAPARARRAARARSGMTAAADVYPFELGQTPHLPLPVRGGAGAAARAPHGAGRACSPRWTAGRWCGSPSASGGRGRADARRRGVCADRARCCSSSTAVRTTVPATALRRAAVLSQERTTRQDPAFAIRAIVDIALRALSPAVNDPTTGVNAIDGLESLLLFLGRRDLERGRITDAAGPRAARLSDAGLAGPARARAGRDPPLRRRLARRSRASCARR